MFLYIAWSCGAIKSVYYIIIIIITFSCKPFKNLNKMK